MVRVAGAYYFTGFFYNLLLLYEYRLYRGVKLEREYPHIDFDEEHKQTRMAVMIPAFREENVIGRTLGFLVKASESYDPNLVKIYAGTYPNDPETRRIVKEFEKNHTSLVEEVINPKPGPTTKAQNLNNIYTEVKRENFDLVGIHDAEDFIPPNTFNAANYRYMRRARDDEKLAGLQFAVRAKPDNYSLTNLVYLLMLRSSNLFLTTRNRGFIPSHGTGTYYKRETLDEIHKRRGYIWDERNFTEDFEISLYLYYAMGKTLLIQSVVYDTATGKYNITVLNNGEQQVIADRLKVGFVDISGKVDYALNITVYAMDGAQLSSSQAIQTNWKVIIVAGLPSTISNPAYVFINHEICGKISNDYLLG